MTYVTLSPLPGVCKVDSAYASSFKSGEADEKVAVGRITDMQNCRFIAGLPEKIGGYVSKLSSPLLGVPRGQKAWRDLSQNIYDGIGTSSHLYVYLNGTVTDITPLKVVVTGTLSGAITTSSGSSQISIAHTNHGLQVGDYVQLTASAVVGGLTVAGTYYVKVRTDANNYVVDVGTNATSSTTGGGTITYNYYRIVLSNPFTTVSGSNLVTVTHTAHGATAGDYVTITSATAVAGLTISGEYSIISAATNTYVIQASANANASTTGGGTPNFQYNIPTGLTSAASASGYGIGGYGLDSGGGYGTTAISTISVGARVWFLDNYGQQLYACPYGGQIYVWDPVIAGRAYPLYGSPVGILAMFITPERYVFALGQTGNYMIVQWPDQSNSTDWIPTAANTANARTLQIGSYLVGGVAARDGASLIFTNTTAYLSAYNGGTFIYDSTSQGMGTGLAGPLAAVSVANDVYWMGQTDFWYWNGATQQLPTDDIRDFVFKNINWDQRSKFHATRLTAKKEVWFYYCSAGSDEIDSYVIYHIDQNCFSTGTKSRTSVIDASLYRYPISTDADGNMYDEEYGLDGNGSAIDSYIVFSPTVVLKGDSQFDLMGFLPDFQRQLQDLTLSITVQDHPKDTPTTVLTTTINQNESVNIEDLRESSRMIGFKVESNAIGGDFRLGMCQADIYKAAARR